MFLKFNKTNRGALMYMAVLFGLICVLTVLQGRLSVHDEPVRRPQTP